MRIEFFHIDSVPETLYWDVTDNGYSVMTGEKSRAVHEVPGNPLTTVDGFFIPPYTTYMPPLPAVPVAPEKLISWLIKSRLFRPISTLRILFGDTHALLRACRDTPQNFPRTIHGYMQIPEQRHATKKLLEELREQGGAEKFQNSAKNQAEEIQADGWLWENGNLGRKPECMRPKIPQISDGVD